ncbi:hypothetical protein ACFWH4_27055 [Streptomyces sp. NPDC127091]|uniref:hypothetical protein n=1 Tax=Streptomyces sp. NPDC127091 TaxID=3347134 RepID=UPI00366121F6
MRALPARRIAFGALCAVLLVGVTGPAALAADPAGEHGRVASPGAPLVQVRNSDVRGDELAPVADLLTAVTRADDGRLPAAGVRMLGDTAKDALKKAEAKQQATRAMPFASAPAPGVLLPAAEPDPVSDALDNLWDAVDRLLDLLLPGDDTMSAATADATKEETTDAATEETAGATTDATTEEFDEILDEILGEIADGADDTTDDAADGTTDDAADSTLSWLDDLLVEMEKLIDELSVDDPQVSVVGTQTTSSSAMTSGVTSSSGAPSTPVSSAPDTASPVVTLPATASTAPAVVLSAD